MKADEARRQRTDRPRRFLIRRRFQGSIRGLSLHVAVTATCIENVPALQPLAFPDILLAGSFPIQH